MIKENENLQVYALTDVKNLKVHGRTTGCLSPLTMFWTGSAIEVNAKGSELWISIVINSAFVSRQMLTAGRYWICVFRGMNENAIKNVRIVKDVQAMSGDPGCFLKIHDVKF